MKLGYKWYEGTGLQSWATERILNIWSRDNDCLAGSASCSRQGLIVLYVYFVCAAYAQSVSDS